MFNDLSGIDREDHELKKRLECELPKLQRISSEYRRWWRVQVGSLMIFLISLVLSVIQSWWYLVPACLFLGFSLYANGRRTDLSARYAGAEAAIIGKGKTKD